jgi:hypothetical protein
MIWDWQQALYQRLSTDEVLSRLARGVYDDVPTPPRWPYVAIGEYTAAPDDSHTSTGLEATLTLHIWSRYRGNREVLAILERLRERLHNSRWEAVDATQVVGSRVEFVEILRDPDGETRHGVVRIRTWLQKA